MESEGAFLWSPELNKLRIFYVPSVALKGASRTDRARGKPCPQGSVRCGAIRGAGDDRQKHQRYLRPVDRSSVEAGKYPVIRRNQRGRLGENHGEVKNL